MPTTNENLEKSANFLQSDLWGKVNELIGHKVIKHSYDSGAFCLMIVKNARRGRYLEIPGGPILNWYNKSIIKSVFDDIISVAKAEKCVFIRFRPMLLSTPENLAILTSLGARKSPMHLAAEHTVILDLTKSEDELLADMRRQTRYEVKRAEKLGIEVKKSSSEAIFREFHRIQSETAKRQNFIPPDEKTLLAEHKAFGENAEIFVATTGENGLVFKEKNYSPNLPIAYGLILKHGEEADYYEAASTDLNLVLPGAYAIEWEAIKSLKSEGYTRYNLWGIAPLDEKTGKPIKNHRYSGVTTFKTGFGGKITEYVPAHDLIISKPKYLKNLAIETIRRRRRHL